MELTINVRVDVSERLEGLACRLLEGLGGRSGGDGRDGSNSRNGCNGSGADGADAEAAAAAAVESSAAAEAAAAPAPTAEDVRQAMVDARKRIVGAGWDDPESDSYKFYHRTLVSMFKAAAALHGAAKPSQLAQDERQGFIEDVGRICVDGRGKLCTGYEQAPF